MNLKAQNFKDIQTGIYKSFDFLDAKEQYTYEQYCQP